MLTIINKLFTIFDYLLLYIILLKGNIEKYIEKFKEEHNISTNEVKKINKINIYIIIFIYLL